MFYDQTFYSLRPQASEAGVLLLALVKEEEEEEEWH